MTTVQDELGPLLKYAVDLSLSFYMETYYPKNNKNNQTKLLNRFSGYQGFDVN